MFDLARHITMNGKVKRTVAVTVILCVVVVLLASVALMATHVHHEFGPQPCATCVKIENCLAVLKTISSVLALCAGMRFFAAFWTGRGRFFATLHGLGNNSLVSQGIRLNI
jgi:hypothetical protein